MKWTCASCRWFEPIGAVGEGGWCKRYPPQAVLHPESRDPRYAGCVEEEHVGFCWPEVSEDDWCGEMEYCD